MIRKRNQNDFTLISNYNLRNPTVLQEELLTTFSMFTFNTTVITKGVLLEDNASFPEIWCCLPEE